MFSCFIHLSALSHSSPAALYYQLLLSHLKITFSNQKLVPIIQTLSFANDRHLAQTGLAKKGTLDPGTDNSRGLSRPGWGGHQPAPSLAFLVAENILLAWPPPQKGFFPWSSSIPGFLVTSKPGWARGSQPSQTPVTENEEGLFPWGKESGRPGRPQQNTARSV